MRKLTSSSIKCKIHLNSTQRNNLLNLALIAPFRGYNIGVRLIEDFLARSNLPKCKDFVETGEIVSKVSTPSTLSTTALTTGTTHQVSFKSFLSITPTLIHHPISATAPTPAFSLIFDENPLVDFVELPEEAVEGGLCYGKVLEGVLRGALEMVSWHFPFLLQIKFFASARSLATTRHYR